MATASGYKVAVDLSILIGLAEEHRFTEEAVERVRRSFGRGSLAVPHHVLAELAHASRRPEDDILGRLARSADSSLERWGIGRGFGKSASARTAGMLQRELIEVLLADIKSLGCRILLTSDPDVLSLSASPHFAAVLAKCGLPSNFVVVSPRDVHEM